MQGLDQRGFNMEKFLVGFVVGVACSYLITTYVVNRLSNSVNNALMVVMVMSGIVPTKPQDEQE